MYCPLYIYANFGYYISEVAAMEKQEQLRKMVNNNGGVLYTAMATAEGISRPTVADFVRRNGLLTVHRGIYCDPSAWTDELYILQLRCPKTILSHETALYLHDLTDREPLEVSVTAKTGYNPSHSTRDGVKVFTVKASLFELGKIEAKTAYGHTVFTYDMERTICDLVRSRSSMDAQVYQDALKQYVKRKDKNLHHLISYARLFHVEKIIMPYLEVLL